jgi:CRP-like cAMP-binding protein
VINEYLNRLSEISPLNEASRLMLSDYIQSKYFKKGDYILNYGEICKYIYFVEKGFIRIFYYKNGKDITEWFANDKQFFFSISSYFEQIPSKLFIEAIEDCEIIMLSKVGYEKLRKINLEIANLFVELLSISLIMSQKRMESLQFESAEQRYIKLLKEQPEILKKAPLQFIATFLGITKETLSRIRAKE